MKMCRRIISAILAVSAAALTLSCGEETQSVETTALSGSDTSANDGSLPENLDFGGETINIYDQPCENYDIFMLNQTEESGDTVNDAIFRRNLKVQEDLNVKLNIETCLYSGNDQTDKKASSTISKMVLAGDTEYDLTFAVQFDIAPIAAKGILMDLSKAKYIDFSRPWWYMNYINEASVGGKYYILTGDITLGVLRKMSCFFVNEEQYKRNCGTSESLYDTVLDGKWTFDKLSNTIKDLYSDLNGDSKEDKNDYYGMIVNNVNNIDHFTYDSGFRSTTRSKDGIPELSINNERTVNFVNDLMKLYYDNQGTCIFDWTETDTLMPVKFEAGETVFYPAFICTAELMRSMEKSFLIIPYPKYEESDANYISLAHDTSEIVAVPSNCTKTEAVCAVMEELAKDGYDTILPAYYDKALKLKYARDSSDKAMRIIDLIHDSASTDFGFIYNYALGGAGLIMRQVIGQEQPFTSYYASNVDTYKTKLSELIASLN